MVCIECYVVPLVLLALQWLYSYVAKIMGWDTKKDKAGTPKIMGAAATSPGGAAAASSDSSAPAAADAAAARATPAAPAT